MMKSNNIETRPWTNVALRLTWASLILCDLLCKYLSRCVIGASLNEIEEEEEAETEVDDESKITVPVEGTYKIIGTLKNRANTQPAFVEEIVAVCKLSDVN